MAYPPAASPDPNMGKPPSPEAEPTGIGIGPQPGAVAPSKLVTLPFTPEFIKEMLEEVKLSTQRRAEYEKEWDILLKEYIPTVIASGAAEAVKTNLHFRNVHTKLPQIFYMLPDLYLEPLGPMKDPVGVSPLTGQPITAEDAINVRREFLNSKLGDDGIDASWLMDELLTDCLAWSGIAGLKTGFRAVMKPYQKPVMMPDPNFVPPPQMGILGLGPVPTAPLIPRIDPATGQPVTETIMVPVFEEVYARRVSPKKLLFASDLRTGRVDDDACWIGMDFFYTDKQIQAAFDADVSVLNLTASSEDDRVAETEKDKSVNKSRNKKKYHGYELWIRASEYDPAQPHPQAVHQLVLLEGMNDKPLVYRPSPDQTFDEFGKLTPDSLVGYPIEILSLRDQPDSPFVYSDAAFVNSSVKQLNTSVQQSIKLRDAAIAKMLYDEDAFTKEEIERIKNMTVGEFMAVKGGLLAQGADKILAPATQPTSSRDDYRLAAALKQSIDEALGISAAEAGVVDDSSVKTATEVASAGAKANKRLAKDQQRAIKFYLRFVRKFDTLLIRYTTADEYVAITGKLGEKRMEVWNAKMMGSRHSYKIKPDSQLMIDAARDRQQLLAYLKETMADPMINRNPIHKKVARLFGLDPSEVVMDPAMMAMMQAGGVNAPAPPGVKGPETGPGPAPAPGGGGGITRREHAPTGARPNAPEPGTGVTPNVPRAVA